MPEPRIHDGRIKAKPEAMVGRLRARSQTAISPEEVVIVTEAAPKLSYSGMAVPANHPVNDYGVCVSESSGLSEARSSSCGDGEGRVSETARPSPDAEGPADLLHELSNLMTTVLLNAQMLEWKLPPYSHLKRPVREVARTAQRATELMRRLQQHSAQAIRSARGTDPGAAATAEDRPTWPAYLAVPSNAAVEAAVKEKSGRIRKLTTGCDPRTSHAFPKGDDSDGR